jgi:predicted metal-binding membrane protein
MEQPEAWTKARPSLVAKLVKRQALVALLCVLAMAALAWWWLAWPAAPVAGSAPMAGMPGMDIPMPIPAQPQPWSAAYLVATFVMWAVMMVAMMLPSAAPMIALHRVFSDRRGLGAAGTLAFAASYVVLWAGFAAIAAVLQAALVDLGWVTESNLRLGHGWAIAVLLCLAALYQLTPLKRQCLAACQAPFAFVVRYWRPGVSGAIGMGLRHGLFCIGCCGALMLLLFVGGVMNLAWIALLSTIVLAEKYAPPRWRLDLVLGAALLGGAFYSWVQL